MPLVQRISRLLRADAHAVLDRIEEPREMLRQSIRDMQSAIEDNEKALGEQQKQLSDLDARKSRARARLEAMQRELDLCLDEQKIDLARKVIRKRLAIAGRMTLIDDDRRVREEDIAELESVLGSQRRSLEALRQRADVFLHRCPAEPPGDDHIVYPDVSDGDVEIALLQEQRRREAS